MLFIWSQEAKGDQDDPTSLGSSVCTACWLYLTNIIREREEFRHAMITFLKSTDMTKCHLREEVVTACNDHSLPCLGSNGGSQLTHEH